jgi:hypothetical protein
MARFGFRMGRSGAHASRTMMLEELQTLLDALPDFRRSSRYFAKSVDVTLARDLWAKGCLSQAWMRRSSCAYPFFEGVTSMR